MEFKVLGASPKNLQAIQNALSIKGTPNTVEYPHADMGYKEENENLEFVFPFQMSVTQDESGSAYLTMNEGRVQINTQYEDRVYVFAEPYTEMPLDELEAKIYRIILLVMYDPTVSKIGEYVEGRMYRGHVYFVEDGATTANIPQTRGIFSIPLGYLTVEEIETEEGPVKTYSIEQEIIGNFPITMGHIHHAFSITATVDMEDGMVKNDYEKSDFTIRVQPGNVVFSDDVAYTEEYIFTPEFGTTYIYAHLTPNSTPKASIYVSDDQYGLYGKIDGDNPEDEYYILIGAVDFNEGGIEIIQETTSTITFTVDTYKVKIIEEDATPGYISGKFRFMQPDVRRPVSGYTDTFIGADLIKEKASVEGEEEKYNYYLAPTFLYKEIEDYDPTKKGLVLALSGEDLRWRPGSFPWDVSGCLSELFELRDVKKYNNPDDEGGGDKDEEEIDKMLVWKSEFETVRIANPYILVENAENGCLEKVTYSAEGVKQGLFVWNFTSSDDAPAGPNVVYPPLPEEGEEDKTYVYAGNKDGFDWHEYHINSGIISLTGSILNVFDIDTFVDDESGEEKQCLYVWTEIDPGYEEQYHWLSLEADGSLSYWNYESESFSGVESIQCFDNGSKEPFILPTEPYNEDEFYLLGGDDEHGLYWTPLFETISGLYNVVSVSESDDFPGFLNEKIYSDNLSLKIEDRMMDGYQYLNIDIDPEYFMSTTDSILLEIYQGGDDYEHLNLNINPEYFTSSDGSISIEPISDGEEPIGLDFIISSHLVQVNETDTSPGYLQDKIEIDPALQSFLILEPSEDSTKLLLKPAMEVNGLITIQNGEVQVLEAPATGSHALIVNEGVFSWEEISDCENACSGEEETEGEV